VSTSTSKEADAIIGKRFGIATGFFGLLGLVGIDQMPTILRSLQNATPAGDAVNDYDTEPPLLARMIAENRLGRKSIEALAASLIRAPLRSHPVRMIAMDLRANPAPDGSAPLPRAPHWEFQRPCIEDADEICL
jgi:3-hydroxyacyl-CoA dehydrogenase, C-terminal domain